MSYRMHTYNFPMYVQLVPKGEIVESKYLRVSNFRSCYQMALPTLHYVLSPIDSKELTT